jgi:hypothetical protein
MTGTSDIAVYVDMVTACQNIVLRLPEFKTGAARASTCSAAYLKGVH